jgi:hypothetical protein
MAIERDYSSNREQVTDEGRLGSGMQELAMYGKQMGYLEM